MHLYYEREENKIMEKRKNFLKVAVVFLIAVAMFLSTIAVTANTSTETISLIKFYNEIHKGSARGNSKGVVLWDNGMFYTRLIASQWDSSYPFEAITADDFQFEKNTVVTDVHWIGAYGHPKGDYDYDWNVSFYMDRGDGMAPGTKIYEQVFPNAELHETFIEEVEKWDSWIFSYWVDLADPISFIGGEKYWISIQGVGIFPPQSFLSGHFLPIVLHEGVFKSPYFGYYNWTDISEVTGGKHFDWCFQLTGDDEPATSDLECEDDLRWDEVSSGTVVNSTFSVSNIGDVGSMLEWEVLSYPDWGTNWSSKWIVDWLIFTNGGFVGTTTAEEIFIEVKAPDKKSKKFTGEIVLVNSENAADTCIINVVLKTPRDKTIDTQLKNFLQKHPNLFPLLKILFGF